MKKLSIIFFALVLVLFFSTRTMAVVIVTDDGGMVEELSEPEVVEEDRVVVFTKLWIFYNQSLVAWAESETENTKKHWEERIIWYKQELKKFWEKPLIDGGLTDEERKMISLVLNGLPPIYDNVPDKELMLDYWNNLPMD